MPRLFKNPFMSLWLSAANKMANTGRGAMMAAARRQQSATAAETAKAVTGFWQRALQGPTHKRRD